MSPQRFIISANPNSFENMEIKIIPKEKVMSYEEKSVGSTSFFKCEACPYMALAEDDIKFHLFTVHPELAKRNGLAENIQINCPGCSSVFEEEETLRTHLRSHHKMGFKDVKKMIKSLVQIALKNAKLKKDIMPCSLTPALDVKIPQVIEILPDPSNIINEQLPKGVAFISVNELHKMSTPNYEKIDPKEVIQEASINIVYTEEAASQFISVSKPITSPSPCNVVQTHCVPPDLISSSQPRNNNINAANDDNQNLDTSKSYKYKPKSINTNPEDLGTLCSINKCHIRLKDTKSMAYHKQCHQNGKLQCPECRLIFATAEPLHSHLWKVHSVDLELPTCDICGFKTFKRHRLLNIHMKCHKKVKAYTCTICTKAFKNANQLYKHRSIHKKGQSVQCHICKTEFFNQNKLRLHISAVHEKIKPFKCSHCDYSSARKEELKLHVRSHTGDKPYACDQCSYRSGDHNAMRRHKHAHSNDTMYKCKYCPYSSIQSTVFAFHMLSSHPDVDSGDVHCCPYCPFKTVNKDKYSMHLNTHTHNENESITRDLKTDKAKSWTIPSEPTDKTDSENVNKTDENPSLSTRDASPKTVNSIPIEVYDCDSLPDIMSQEYLKNYCMTSSNETTSKFNNQDMVTDLSKDDITSDCVISESLNIIERHQFNSQHPLQMPYDGSQSNLLYLGSPLSMDQNLRQSENDSHVGDHSAISSSITNSIMANLPIRLPPAPICMRNNITLRPADKISLPMPKVTGPIITTTQILPVPSSCHSPVNVTNDNDRVPRKKAKISVKSNLVLKGPDQVNMFHSQQKMAFKQLEDNERYGLGSPVTFNNLITTQFMQLPPEPVLSESPGNIMTYAQENMLSDTITTPADNQLTDDSQIFSFNPQMNVNTLQQKIQTNDPSYIKLEATIKQNTQSPSLESMCTANLLNSQALSREYKASPPLEDIHKNINEIKNEVKSDTFYNIPLNNSANNAPIDQYLMDNLIPDQYSCHLDPSTAVMPDIPDQSDVIEIDDNSDDNKLLSRYDMNFPLESLYLMHNDFHFLESEIQNNTSEIVSEMNRMVTEVSAHTAVNQKEDDLSQTDLDLPNYIQGKKDPMMNTSVRLSTNKINVKNIELMKN